MTSLVAATVLVGMLGLANLLLMLGVLRRLRANELQLAALSRQPGGLPLELIAPAGTPVGEVVAEATDATVVTGESLRNATVAFLSPHCEPCRERLPEFVAYAKRLPTAEVLSVVVGTPPETADYVSRLEPVGPVVVEADDGPLSRAFGVTGFPAFAQVRDGVIASSGFELSALPDVTRA